MAIRAPDGANKRLRLPLSQWSRHPTFSLQTSFTTLSLTLKDGQCGGHICVSILIKLCGLADIVHTLLGRQVL